MYKSFKDLGTIRFPVYSLPSSDWYRQDGVLFLDDGRVIDDKNMPGKSLGVRRLQCGRSDLLKLRRAYLDFNSMIRSKRKVFVDSNGVPFIYEKTFNSPLIHHTIKRIDKKDDVSVLWLNGIAAPFTLPRPPVGDARYARVLYYKGLPWLLYDFTSSRGRDSYKRV